MTSSQCHRIEETIKFSQLKGTEIVIDAFFSVKTLSFQVTLDPILTNLTEDFASNITLC